MKNYFYKKYQFKFTNTFYNKLIILDNINLSIFNDIIINCKNKISTNYNKMDFTSDEMDLTSDERKYLNSHPYIIEQLWECAKDKSIRNLHISEFNKLKK
jgi:hypothetical protein